ncbi:hypothetical protein CDL12_09134 [Handroanthus impetiginosus]|uniref:Uncharacterized protein n=1 Tax=Handroanthus impetiginosus TaxID=429701 RepID=A0A2G9HL20_9LAMI|nr:hypothetical protein CDL12_09134 [Handroanthus impetiginosus]
MEMKMGVYNEKSSSNKNRNNEDQEGVNGSCEDLNFKNLSKLIVPPLGASGYTSQNDSKGRIISPMDTRYR